LRSLFIDFALVYIIDRFRSGSISFWSTIINVVDSIFNCDFSSIILSTLFKTDVIFY